MNIISFKKWLETTEINWTLPVVNQEMPKMQDALKSLKLDQNQLTKVLNQAKLVNLPNNIWSKVKNLNKIQTQTKPQQTGTISTVTPQNIKTKVDLKAPIVIMSNNQPYMVSGQDSFQAARDLGTYPKALVASM